LPDLFDLREEQAFMKTLLPLLAKHGAIVILTAALPVLAGAAPKSSGPPVKNLIFEHPSGPSSAPKVTGAHLKLSLREAITLALARNFEIAIEAHNPRIRQNEVTEEKSAFDPAVTAGADANKTRTDTPSRLFAGGGQQVVSEQILSAGIVKKTVTGAELSLIFKTIREDSNSRQKFINPDFDSSLTFTISQPLLKNYGVDVNKAGIRIAAVAFDQSLLAYRGKVISVIERVELAYWDLVFAISNTAFRKKSLDLARDLLRRNRIQVEVGTLAPIEILEAQAAVATREEDVIVAERTLKDREDVLKKLLNVSGSLSSWRLRISPADRAVFKPVKIDEMASALRALKTRADLESARLEIEKNKIRLKRDRRNLLPGLDLSASASNQGVNDSFSNSIDRQSGNKGYSFSGGLSFRLPFGNREAKARVGKSRVQLQRANATYAQLEQSIIEEVRRSVRRVRTDIKRIQASRLARRLAEDRLDAQEKKYQVGLSTSRDVLEDQERVANALTNEVQALVDYNKSLAQLGRVSYSTLQRFKIQMGDPLKSGRSAKP
jgi:outer membrane protein TolC